MAKTSIPPQQAPAVARRAKSASRQEIAPEPQPPAGREAKDSMETAMPSVAGQLSRGAMAPVLHRMALVLSPRELARAHAARVLDNRGRAEIFREHLWHLFPSSRPGIADMPLSAATDYTKMLQFMDTGAWPKATPRALQQRYAQIMRPLLAAEKVAYVASVLGAGADGPPVFAAIVSRAWDDVAEARLRGAVSLRLPRLVAVEKLPGHLWTIKSIKILTLGELSLQKLPPEIAGLTQLEELHIHDATRLLSFPDAIAQLTQLRRISVSGSGTHRRFALPAIIAKLPNLKSVSVPKRPGEREDRPRPSWLPPQVAWGDAAPSDWSKQTPWG